MKIFIGPGHGERDPGAVSGARQEKNERAQGGTGASGEMIRRGHTVGITRNGDTYPSLAERVSLANGFGRMHMYPCTGTQHPRRQRGWKFCTARSLIRLQQTTRSV